MKLSFSTRGWPGFSFDEMLEVATDMDFGGIEVYNLPKFGSLVDRGGPFHKYNTAATVRKLRERQLTIPCFDTSFDISGDGAVIDEIKSLMDMAYNARVPSVVACALRDNENAV